MRYFYVLACLFVANFSIAQPHLLKDINVEAGAPTYGSLSNVQTIEFKGRLYFDAYSTEYGHEFFSTDGTEAGTTLLKNIYPNQKGFGVFPTLAALDNTLLLFIEGEDGRFLWKSDGTESGTTKVAAVEIGTAADNIAVLNNVAYFVGKDADHGYELWRTDGTSAGTHIVKDVFAGTQSGVGSVVASGNQIFFTGSDGTSISLWKTDGTDAGTVKLADKLHQSGLTIVPGGVWFKAKDVGGITQVWKSDGTVVGTVAVTNFSTAYTYDQFAKMVLFGNKMIVRMFEMATGSEWYAIDMTSGEAKALTNSSPDNIGNQALDVPLPVIMGGMVWLIGDDGNFKMSLWKSDGTPAGSSKAMPIDWNPWDYPKEMAVAGSKIYITVDNRLKVTDGTTPLQTVLVSGTVERLREFKGQLFFSYGEPYLTDGTVAGTHVIKDLNSETGLGGWALTTVGNNFMFYDTKFENNQYRFHLWRSDGTEAGTTEIQSFVSVFQGDKPVSNNNKVLFQGYDLTSKPGVWISDGTAAGTKLLKDGNWYQPNGSYGRFRWIGNTGYIFAGDKQLWKTDGTPDGTVKVATMPYEPKNIHASINNQLFFTINGLNGPQQTEELWRSDGTAAGTLKISTLIDVVVSTSADAVVGMMGGDTKLFILQKRLSGNYQLLVSDGTDAGTKVVKEITPGPPDRSSYFPQIQTVVNDVAYLSLAEGKNMELWRSDGTAAGTFMVKDINPGAAPSFPTVIATKGSTIYFTANDGMHGVELWTTDGTAANTKIIKDIYPGALSATYSNSIIPNAFVNGVLYFAADDGEHGTELWKTDGSEEGTSFAWDINPGPLGGVGAMTAVGSKLYFSGNEPTHGRELWVYDLSVIKTQKINFPPIETKTVLTPSFPLLATASSGLNITFSVVSGPATITDSRLTVTGPGTVVVRASQAGNFEYEPAFADQSFDVILVLGLEDHEEIFSASPNPATGSILIRSSSPGVVTLKDMLGRDAINTTISNLETTLDVSSLSRGMYILKLTKSDKSVVISKIILR